MAKYLWREEYGVGNQTIDDQHRRLFDLLDKLYDAVCAGDGVSQAESVLQELMDYTREHFYAEEAMMREARYPGVEAHCVEHERLLSQVKLRIAAIQRGDRISSIELLEFMNNWLSSHILQSDRQVCEYIKLSAN